jgi:hypothetical protein
VSFSFARSAAAVAFGATLVGGLALTAGCSLAGGKQEFVVYFTADATDAQKDAVRNACPGVGKAVLEPRDRSDLQTARTYPVRYDVTKASAPDRSAVLRCVSGQPGVRGINQSDSGS